MQEGGVEGWLEVIRILVWIARRYVADEDLGCVGENGRKNERNRRRVQIFFSSSRACGRIGVVLCFWMV